VIFGRRQIAVGGGGESISLVQNDHANKFHTQVRHCSDQG